MAPAPSRLPLPAGQNAVDTGRERGNEKMIPNLPHLHTLSDFIAVSRIRRPESTLDFAASSSRIFPPDHNLPPGKNFRFLAFGARKKLGQLLQPHQPLDDSIGLEENAEPASWPKYQPLESASCVGTSLLDRGDSRSTRKSRLSKDKVEIRNGWK